MAQLTPSQRAWRGRIEAGLKVAAPVLDLVLAAGDRLARAVERDDLESGPVPLRVGDGSRRSRLGGEPTR